MTEAHLLRCEDLARSTRDDASALPNLLNLQRAHSASIGLRRAKLHAHGVDCPSCKGEGEHAAGVMRGDTTSPSEITYMVCPTCQGNGKVLPPERDDWIRRHGQ